MAFRAGRVEVELGAKLDRREIDLYEKKLKEIRAQAAKKDAFKAQLGGDYDPKAFNAYQRELKRTEHATNDNVKAQGRLRTSFGALYGSGGAVFAAAGGLAGLVLGLRGVVKANAEAEVSQTKMATQLKALNISYDAHAKEIDKVIQKTSQLAGLDDEDLQDAFTAIVRSSGSVKEALKATGLAADFARAKHLDVAKAGDLLGKVYAGNAGALGRYGIKVEPVTKAQDALAKNTKKATDEQIKQAKAQDKQATILATIAEAQRKFAGQGEAYGKTQQGAFDRVSVAFENLQETIGKKLGPTITRAANALAKFIGEMADGTGKGGDFVEFLRAVGVMFGRLFRLIRQVTDIALSFFTTLYDGVGGFSRLVSQLIPGNDALGRFADRMQEASDKLNKIREVIRPAGHAFDDLGDSVRGLNRRLSSDAGTKAAGKNFRSLKNAIARNINDAVSDTDHGMGRIRLSLSKALKDVGASDIKPFKGLTVAGTDKPLPKAGGGWIGAPGLVGGDIIPAMLAPGEAVLNRHQQAVIEGMLGDGFLDRLFERVDTPHYFAAGGRAGGLQPAVASLANRLASQFGLTITSTTGGQHAANSYHYQGLAADLGGPGSAMFKASEWIKSSGTYRSLLEGIHNPNLAVDNGKLFSGAGPFGGVWAGHANHIHIALRALGAALAGAGGGGAAQISAPQVGGSGALRAIVQGALSTATKGANASLDKLAGAMGGGDISSAGVKGGYSKQQLAALWRRAGGDPGRASLMAAIALAESGGNPRVHNPSGASGLWQILGLPFPGDPFNPSTNARMAVAKYESQGLGAWEAYTNGAYRSYMSRGGRLRQFFAKGGKAGGSKRKPIKKSTAAAEARDYIRPLASLNTDRVADWDVIQGHVDDWNTRYGIAERTYDLDVEELVKDDGNIDEGAIKERANELLSLISIRQQIVRQLVSARAVARRVVKTYNTIITRLRRSLKHAGKKSRASIRETIGTYTERRDEWRGKLHELEESTLPSARLDLRELVRERGEVLGTKAEPADISDTGGGDLGGDTGTDTGTDTATAPPSAADIAAAALQDLASFNQGRSELLGSYARNFISAFQAGTPGGVFSGSPDELSQAAGTRFFGAGSTGSSLGGATIINNYNQLPDSTATWSQQMRFQVEAMVG
jgi:hypothetical protein